MSNKIDNKHLYVKDLDFKNIKENLKEFLRNQDEFKDVDFDGSNISALLDVLAYNTHYNALNTNVALSEIYLDSAQDRANVVSRAAEIGYTPRGSISSSGKIKLRLENVNPTYVTPSNTVPVPRGTQFRTSINGTRYFFTNPSSHTLNHMSGDTYEGEIEIVGGRIRTAHYIVNEHENPSRKFSLPTDNIDFNLLRVYVKDSISTSLREPYTRVDTIISDKASTDNIYFVYDSILRRPYIQFGDNVFGNRPDNHQYIEVEYIVSDEGKAAGAKNFTLVDDLGGTGDSYIEVVERIGGGGPKESVEQIKRNSYLSRFTQDRSVIEDDYVSHLYNEYPVAESISCWGGERHDPPTYGRVFISIKPVNGTFLSESEKQSVIQNYIRGRSMVTIIPEIVDPQYVNIDMNVSVNYNRRESSLTLNEIMSTVESTVREFGHTNLNRHNSNLNYSDLLREVYESDAAIRSVLVDFSLLTQTSINKNSLQYYEFNFGNKISSISSSEFTFKGKPGCVLKNDKNTVYVQSGDDTFSVGEIYNETGIVKLEMIINDAAENMLILYASPVINNIESDRNIILGITEISVSVNP